MVRTRRQIFKLTFICCKIIMFILSQLLFVLQKRCAVPMETFYKYGFTLAKTVSVITMAINQRDSRILKSGLSNRIVTICGVSIERER